MKKNYNIPLSYAHRVWVPEHTYNMNGALIHGHSATISVVVDIENGKHRDIEDFLQGVSSFVGDTINGRFFIDNADPMFYTLVMSMYESALLNIGSTERSNLPVLDPILYRGKPTGAFRVNLSPIKPLERAPVGDVLSSYLIFQFSPSADNMASWLFGLISDHSPAGCKIASVTFSNFGGESFEVDR